MFRKWCETTSCNGVIDLLESKESRNPCKLIFWIIVMVSMICASIWFTFRTVQSYIDTPIITTVSTVREPNMPLPQVLICYQGGLNVKTMESENLSDNLRRDLTSVLSYQRYQSNKSVTDFEEFLTKKMISVRGTLDMFGYNCSDILTSFLTQFGSVSCNNATTLYNELGKCYLFPHTGYQTWPGMYGGLTVFLRQPSDTYYERYQEEAKAVMLYNGFSLSLEKNVGLQRNGKSLIIPLNAKVEVTLNVRRFVRLEKENKCEASPTMFNSNTCYYKCFNDEMINLCNCLTAATWDDALYADDIQICNPFTVATNCTLLNSPDVLSCQSRCKPICDEWIFESALTYVTTDSNSLQNQTSFSTVSIAYATMQYTKVI